MTALHFFSCNLGSPSPAAVMDPTPSKHKPTFQEGDRNPERGKDTTVTMQTVEVSTRMEHVNAGNLQFLMSLQT